MPGTETVRNEIDWNRMDFYAARRWTITSVPYYRLRQAVEQRNIYRIESLFRQYTDVFIHLHHYRPPHEPPIFKDLVNDRDFEMLAALINTGISPLIPMGNNTIFSPMYVAAQNRDYEMVRYLFGLGIDFNMGSEFGPLTELNLAIHLEDVELVALLTELGYDVNMPMYSRSRGDYHGQSTTFLHQAVSRGNPDIISLLLQAGANPNQFDLRFSQSQSGRTLRMQTPYEIADGPIKELMREYGAIDPREMQLDDYSRQPYSGYGGIIADRVRFRSAPILDDDTILGSFNSSTRVRLLNVTDEKMQIEDESHYWGLVEDTSGRIGWLYLQYFRQSQYSFIDKDDFYSKYGQN